MQSVSYQNRDDMAALMLIRNGELDELVYSKDDIENSLVECGAAAESDKCS